MGILFHEAHFKSVRAVVNHCHIVEILRDHINHVTFRLAEFKKMLTSGEIVIILGIIGISQTFGFHIRRQIRTLTTDAGNYHHRLVGEIARIGKQFVGVLGLRNFRQRPILRE